MNKAHSKILSVAALCFLSSAMLISSVFSQTISYSYDAAGRLKSVTYSSGASIQYEYDAAGNIVKVTYSAAGPPPKATLVSPSETINTSMPPYTWNAVAVATYYQLYVSDSGAAGKIKAWFTPAETNCAAGSGTCSITPSVALANGAAQWWIQTWNTLGDGPWSDAMNFTVAAGPPGKATLISPSGSISTTTPAYTWKAVSGSTWYYLWVNDSGTASGKIQMWYTAAQAGCASGTGNCTVTPTVPLANGAAQWWIQTYNDSGYGPWSEGMAFVVGGAGPPGKATLIAPNGSTASATPAYSWNAVSGSTWYRLWVNDSAGTAKIQKWYTVAEAGCSSGTGTCAVIPASSLAKGSYQWWVQTWNDNGNGPWSDSLSFTVTAAQMRQSPVRRQAARSVQ